MSLPPKLQAARLKLLKKHPYFSTAVFALRPVKSDRVGTMAVDAWWRLYYNEAAVKCWSVDEVAGVLLHEVSHLLRDHAGRRGDRRPHDWNVAADAEINDDIKSFPLPLKPILPKNFGWEEGRLAEEYYAELQEASLSVDASTNQSDGDEAGSQDGKNASADTDGGGGDSGRSNSSDSSQSAVTSVGDGGGDGSSDTPSSGDASSENSTPPNGANTPSSKPQVGAGRCGSCATGVKETWELDSDDESVPAVKRAEADLIRRKVAQEIKNHSRQRGEVPAGWERWAEELLNPKVNWRRELAACIRRAMADVAGAVDYSYSRPSRRQSVNPKVVSPALRQPLPTVAVVVDTSGSIGDDELAQAVAEITGVLKAQGGRNGVTVLSCDAKVHTVKKVLSRQHLKNALQGGGGTDMRVGIEEAMKLRPRPDVVIVITDGYTPWQKQPPRGVKVIVALLGDGAAPSWAKVVRVEDEK